jgi:hypothetical protein
MHAPVVSGTGYDGESARFAANAFHGLDIGLDGSLKNGPWIVDWRAKVAIGANVTSAQINGMTTATVGGVTTTSPDGLLAQPTNIGSYSQTRFAVPPDLALSRLSIRTGLAGFRHLRFTRVDEPATGRQHDRYDPEFKSLSARDRRRAAAPAAAIQ